MDENLFNSVFTLIGNSQHTFSLREIISDHFSDNEDVASIVEKLNTTVIKKNAPDFLQDIGFDVKTDVIVSSW